MANLIIAVAQSASIKGDVEKNILYHLKFVNIATANGADLIIFPELSLTGYEPELANRFAMTVNDPILYPLIESAGENNLYIIAGAPFQGDCGEVKIGLFCFHPDKTLSIHTKRYLHPGEEKYFTPGNETCLIDLKNERIALAICADISNPAHPAKAAADGATIYLASVLVTPNGFDSDAILLRQYAINYNMTVMMSNHSIKTGGYEPAGRSSVWNSEGELLGALPGTEEGIIIMEKINNNWETTRIIKID